LFGCAFRFDNATLARELGGRHSSFADRAFARETPNATSR
jgi:hypothetical protein